MLGAVGRKIRKAYREHQTPHGRQSVKKLMGHGAATNSIELSGDTKAFDRVARKWNVDYAFYKTGPDKCSHTSENRPAPVPAGCGRLLVGESPKPLFRKDGE